jgi:hypothetical protein
MNLQSALKSQYHASLKTLRLAIEQCPEPMWNDPKDGLAAFWRVAYHALFFTHLYLQKDEPSFRPWSLHRPDADALGPMHWESNRLPAPCEPYTRAQILAYWRECDAMVDQNVDAMDLSAPECGFPWYAMGKLEHQLVNIRHIQHHAAALSTRLRREAQISVPWVGKG